MHGEAVISGSGTACRGQPAVDSSSCVSLKQALAQKVLAGTVISKPLTVTLQTTPKAQQKVSIGAPNQGERFTTALPHVCTPPTYRTSRLTLA